ncbi:hypothetical protein GCM10011374_19450 [Kocuria dechangensis]|uniref:PNPLA domain-containing protein n=1 Tax=Kocuria dechangensis TaxID=1176249 RepID=A0A917LTC8_9MICC|nr:DUF3376 domain-containing protein [Kocuria dechangensis]GGG56702.1 hypothetical protein GCM10011374_19450 [Kocuria dechangensis]
MIPGGPPADGSRTPAGTLSGLTVLTTSLSLADATAGQEPAFGRTLRFALALRGGVSLAVWIGGAVAELDVLRRIRLHRDAAGLLHAFLLHPGEDPDPRLVERAAVYARLLAQAGYDRVEFDVLAGASAGGLNGVVHAVAQRAGAGLDPLGRLWEETAGFSRLLRPLGRRPVDSLLRGDGYLWPGLEEVLVAVHEGPEHHPDLVAEHVTVELSATVLDSDPAPHGGAAEGRGDFHFASPERGAPLPPPGNDIPARPSPSPAAGAGAGDDDAARRAAALSRLAYAARATASFPGAFEPATVWSAPTAGPLRDSPRPDLSLAFSAHRDPAELPYRVVDGGVFDNVPIDRALEAARTSRSLRHADRALLYLDPDPPHRAGTPVPDLDLPRLVRTVGATVTRLRRRETGEDEVLALSDFLGDQLAAQGRLRQLAPLLVDWSPPALAERRRAHLRYRGRADADLLGRILTRPGTWQLTSSLRSRAELRPRTPAELTPLREELQRRCDALSRGPLDDPAARAVLRGPQALFDAVSCVLAWIRFLEDLALDPSAAPAPLQGLDTTAARAAAYRLLAVAGHERDRLVGDVLDACCGAGVPTATAVPLWLPAAGPADDPLAESWAELDAVVDELRAFRGPLDAVLHAADDPEVTDPADDADATGAVAWRRAWHESPWRRVPGPEVPMGAADLPPAVAAAGIPVPLSRVVYGEIRGDQAPVPSVVPERLRRGWADDRMQRALDAAGSTATPDEDLRQLLAPGPARFPADSKLAGTGLLNFRGFLATEWRTADWWWGRLDAAAGVAAFLQDLPARPLSGPRPPDAAAARTAGAAPQAGSSGGAADGTTADGTKTGQPAAEDPASALQSGLLGQLGDGDEDRARTSLAAGADRLDRLTPGYRVSLASRGLRVLGRALARTPDLPRGAWELLLFLLQPVLVAAPLLLVPVRAALALVVAAAGLWAAAGPAGASPPGRAGPVLVALAAAALAASLVRSVRSARRRWARVLDAAGTPAAPRIRPAGAVLPAAQHVAVDRGTALRRAAVVAAAAAALLLPAWVAARSGDGAVLVLLLPAVLVLDRVAAAVAVRVPGRERGDELVLAGGVVLASVAAWGLGALAATAASGPLAQAVPSRTLVVTATLALLGALVLTGFLRPGWVVLLALGAGALAGWAGGLVELLTGHGAAGAAAAVLVWASVLWWAPAERMLRAWGPAEELGRAAA